MTKKWSSTASMDGQTKRQASKSSRREAAKMAEIAEEYGLDPIGDFLRSKCKCDGLGFTDKPCPKCGGDF